MQGNGLANTLRETYMNPQNPGLGNWFMISKNKVLHIDEKTIHAVCMLRVLWYSRQIGPFSKVLVYYHTITSSIVSYYEVNHTPSTPTHHHHPTHIPHHAPPPPPPQSPAMCVPYAFVLDAYLQSTRFYNISHNILCAFWMYTPESFCLIQIKQNNIKIMTWITFSKEVRYNFLSMVSMAQTHQCSYNYYIPQKTMVVITHQFHKCSCLSFAAAHWGQVMQICISKLTITGSDHGTQDQRQTMIWTSDGIISTGPLGTDICENIIGIHIFPFTQIHFKMSSEKWRPFCLGLNVLKARHSFAFSHIFIQTTI